MSDLCLKLSEMSVSDISEFFVISDENVHPLVIVSFRRRHHDVHAFKRDTELLSLQEVWDVRAEVRLGASRPRRP